MKYLIVGNWKLNPKTKKEAQSLFSFYEKNIKRKRNLEIVICPPFVYLPLLERKKIKLGAQDAFWENEGPFTGEISPKMLKEFKVSYVILGHSERRRYFKEDDEMIGRKLKKVLKEKLKAILCLGEKKGEGKKTVERQLFKAIEGISKKEIKNLILAYEPVWAIGTGKFCQPQKARAISQFIREILSKKYGKKVSKEIKIIYGGSVDKKNAIFYLKEGLDGLLIGGASLKKKEFLKIIEKISIILKNSFRR